MGDSTSVTFTWDIPGTIGGTRVSDTFVITSRPQVKWYLRAHFMPQAGKSGVWCDVDVYLCVKECDVDHIPHITATCDVDMLRDNNRWDKLKHSTSQHSSQEVKNMEPYEKLLLENVLYSTDNIMTRCTCRLEVTTGKCSATYSDGTWLWPGSSCLSYRGNEIEFDDDESGRTLMTLSPMRQEVNIHNALAAMARRTKLAADAIIIPVCNVLFSGGGKEFHQLLPSDGNQISVVNCIKYTEFLKLLENGDSTVKLTIKNAKPKISVQGSHTELTIIVEKFKRHLSVLDMGNYLSSQEVTVGGHQWQVLVYPHGNSELNEKYISLSLGLKEISQDSQVTGTFSVWIENSKGQPVSRVNSGPGQTVSSKEAWNVDRLIKRRMVLDPHNDIINENDELTLKFEMCTGTVRDQMSPSYTGLCRQPDMLNDFGDFGVKVAVDGEEFTVHEKLLVKHSPVFKSMLSSQMSEGINKEIKLGEVAPAGIVRSMIQFLYTGSICTNIRDVGDCKELLRLAHMYQMDQLKNVCEDYICKEIDVENAVEILQMADLYGARKLYQGALEYIAEERARIIRTNGWRKLRAVAANKEIARDVSHLLFDVAEASSSHDAVGQETGDAAEDVESVRSESTLGLRDLR